MEFKGTKGIWTSVNTCHHPTSEFEQVSFIQTATHCFDVVAMENEEITREQFTANAKLISCAPEMLEMLNRIMKTYDKGTQTYIDCQQLLQKATTI